MTWMKKKSIVLALLLATTAVISNGIIVNADTTPPSTQVTQSKLAAIDTITATGSGDASELLIKLTAPATYTSYKTTAPLRLIIDLSQVTQGTVSAPIEINKANFKRVTVSRYDTEAGVLTRVEIELVKDLEAVLSASPEKPGELKVSFPAYSVKEVAPEKSVTTADLKSENNITNVPEVPIESNVTPVFVEKVASETNSSIVKASHNLTGISLKNNNILISVDGGISEYKSFRLNKPDRFVVDMFDVKSLLPNRLIQLNSAGVASARLGLYPEKVRVVFDSLGGVFPETSISKSDSGLIIQLQNKPLVENPNTPLISANSKKNIDSESKAIETKKISTSKVSSVPTQVSALPVNSITVDNSSTKTVENRKIVTLAVEMIDFQVVDGISRVSVKLNGDSLIDPPIVTPGFVTLTIRNAILPKQLQRSLESKGFISPVLRITPILVKSRKSHDTKIRIALKTATSHEFRHEGDMVYIDFKNPEGITADKTIVIVKNAKKAPVQAAVVDEEVGAVLGGSLIEIPLRSQAGGKTTYKGRKVTLEFADAEVRKIFQLLSEVSNKNFVLGDDVTGNISIKLVNVPWDQALDIILDTKGLDKREEGNIIIIKGKGKFKSQAEEDLELKKQKYRAIELVTESFSINYADLPSVVTQFNTLKSERGSITPDARTNKIFVKDIPIVIEDIRKLLSQIDIPEKQVMIEARIVEASSTFTRSLGVNWGIHYRDGSASFLGINQLDTSFGGLATTAAPTTGLSGLAGGTAGISFGTLTSNISLDLRLNAAASAGLIKIVSTPKVATLNNKSAKITQGQQIPYTSSTSDKVETKFVEAALSLEVTPHINANGTIGMKIDAKNDSVGQATGGSTAPAINKKQATTEMLLRDGETTVIGGIYVDSDNESDDGVPYLMDIPLLGRLFKSNLKTKVKTELLIFITPRILTSI